MELREAGIDVAESAQVHVDGDMAGRDIIKPTTNKFEVRWWAIAMFIGVPLLFIAGWSAWPEIRGPGKMSGVFNVAVAEFGVLDEKGVVSPSEDARQLSDKIFNYINLEKDADPTLHSSVQVRHERVQLVKGSTAEERAKAAHQIASSLGAQLVIYGNLNSQEGVQVFSPEFYIEESKGAEEMLGPTRFGSSVKLSGDWQDVLILSTPLGSRTKALTFFTMGLACFATGNRCDALSFFQEADKVNGWKDVEGKEVLHLWLGTAYATKQNVEADAFDKAGAEYAQALSLNGEYSRAFIGLGNLAYMESSKFNSLNIAKLDKAISYYEKASAAKDKPVTALVDAKVHIGFGNVYYLKGQAGDEPWYGKAEIEYLQVVNPFERGDERLKPLVSQVYWVLGAIEERWRHDYKRASDYYKRGLAAVEKNSKLEADLKESLNKAQTK